MLIALKRYVPLACWLAAALALLCIPFKIAGYGYVPAGDARRHVAQAVGRSLTDVTLTRAEYVMDHSPGWDWLLRKVHTATGWNADALIMFSIISLFAMMFLAPLPWVRRPEAWLAALLATTVATDIMERWAQARPYVLVEAVLAAVLLVWSRCGVPTKSVMAWTVAGIGLSVWMHGAWYLWALPVAAFALAGWWGSAFRLAGCCAAGVLGGALLTGHPLAFLKLGLDLGYFVFREHLPQWMLVGEMQPFRGDFGTIVLLIAVLFWRRSQRKPAVAASAHGAVAGFGSKLPGAPVLALIVICWVLGFVACRFWADWGIPAVLVWLCLQFEEASVETLPADSFKRAALCAMVAVPLALHCSNDLDQRFTKCLNDSHLDAKNPALEGWMPGPNGIFYSANMVFFYDTYYDNPQAPWRYALSFEPAMMPDEDRVIYRRIQASRDAINSFEPWAKKLRPIDRLAVDCLSQPILPDIEWKRVGKTLWIGRKKTADSAPAP